jgi:DNA-binding NtrC family response regulator
MLNTPHLIGASSAIRSVEEDVECASRSDAKVLITGESGVGKEIVARLIHCRSSRRNGPLIPINCAGVPETLLASELFGHLRGSFTDAYRDKRGLLEQAHGGTIFLDEVGEMGLQMQAVLLRFLETGEIQPVGSERRPAIVNVRVITATNRSLLDRVAANEFREDLFYRLNVIHIAVPPLRERREDIPLLLDYYLRHFAAAHQVEVPQLSEEAVARLSAYKWPGNVRELKNISERLVVRRGGSVIANADLPREFWQHAVPTLESVDAVQRESPSAASRADVMFDRLTRCRESFWVVVHEPFMARDMTRDDLRALIRRGLELTRGSYKSLVQLFNMPQDDYPRFLNFLRKYQSHLPIQDFRSLPVRLPGPSDSRQRAVGE